MKRVTIRENLSDYAHKSWSGWMEYLFSKCEMTSDGRVIIPSEFVSRWKRQMVTNYTSLTEKEKDSDQKEADKIIQLIKGH